ncbi:MAG: hypothetical protein ACK53Y_25920 [bacterium]|jgi:hypothetical protein
MALLNDDISTITNGAQLNAQGTAQDQAQQVAPLQTASVTTNAGTVVSPSVTVPFGGRAAHANRNG